MDRCVQLQALTASARSRCFSAAEKDIVYIDAAELARREPSLELHTRPGGRAAGGALLMPNASRGLVAQTADAVIRRLESQGMCVLRDTELLDWHATGGPDPRVSALVTSRGQVAVPTDANVVLCAGAWTPLLLVRLCVCVGGALVLRRRRAATTRLLLFDVSDEGLHCVGAAERVRCGACELVDSGRRPLFHVALRPAAALHGCRRV